MIFASPLSAGFRKYFAAFFVIGSSTVIVILNTVLLVLHFKRPVNSRFGMLFMLLVTFVLYGLLNIASATMKVLPWDTYMEVVLASDELFFLAYATPTLSQQLVTISGGFIALDRVLLMFFPIRYANSRLSLKLCVLTAGFYTLSLASYASAFAAVAYIVKNTLLAYVALAVLQFYVLSLSLLVESALNVLFLLKLREYSKNKKNTFIKKYTKQARNVPHSLTSEAFQTNQIVLFQLFCKSLLCTVPNLLVILKSPLIRLRRPWIEQLDLALDPLFASSVVLSSLFTLCKMRPKKKVVKIVASLMHGKTSNTTSHK
ncbi:hypothetical protein QR680_008898 [Steinernema hermaphroditum]|uniref:G-protein coupled receptors family 1 profile domain-containing protein n=1 Tax=Steinernema hermaphroditum TaxID=289476 RepID=A0AA39IKH6_9BILA|nr:hypothetical protein QR680_008898 [Steinernema hermaphroditum]